MRGERELTDAPWAALAPHLPPRGATGRPAKDHRLVVEALVWRLRTGAPWRDLPERYGPWQSVYTRFCRWQRGGVWDRALAALQAAADARGKLDWSLHFVDGTAIRAHTHAAGAEKGGRGANSAARAAASRPSCPCAPTGPAGPVAWTLTAGQRNVATQLEALLERGAVRRPSGQRRVRPDRVAGDRGYTGKRIRRYLRRRGIGAVIPRLKTEPRRGVRFDRAAYRERNRVERAINRLKGYRALATRYEKLAETFHALVAVAGTVRFWL